MFTITDAYMLHEIQEIVLCTTANNVQYDYQWQESVECLAQDRKQVQQPFSYVKTFFHKSQ